MKYETLLKLVQSIIDSFTNVAVAHLNGLKGYLSKSVFSVKITNPTTKVKVEGDVKVSNLQGLLKAIGGIPIAINALKKAVIANKSVMITNLKDIKFPEFPKKIEVTNPQKEVKITNMKEFTDAVEKVAEFIAKIKYDPRIEVKPADVKLKAPIVNVEAPIVNVPEQKPPVVNVAAPDLSALKKLLEFFDAINAKKPLAVRLSDGKAFYKALEKMAEIYAGSTFSAFQTLDGNEGRGILNRNNELLVTTSDTWSLNEVDSQQNGNLTYLGEETIDGRWRITRVQRVGQYNTMSYATIKNNPAAADYDFPTAWSNHNDLEYNRVSVAL